MLHISSGVDLIEIDRVIQAIDRHGDRFLKRVFTPQELAELKGNPASLAALKSASVGTASAAIIFFIAVPPALAETPLC